MKSNRILRTLVISSLLYAFSFAGYPQTPWHPVFQGIEFARAETNESRLQKVTALKIDLHDPNIKNTDQANVMPYFIIKIVDDETGRGVPLVELSTTSSIAYYTDSQGIIAFYEPGLMNKQIYFYIKAHGYEFEKDDFGFIGKTLNTTPDKTFVIKIHRKNRAQRLYRITGQGIYADSIKANLPVPTISPLLCSDVIGQDSALAAIYNNKIYWFWGDTLKPAYPLGLFRVSGATSAIPRKGGLDPNVGIDLKYFTNANGSVRDMCPFGGEGAIWLDEPLVVKDSNGKDCMLAHYARVMPVFKTTERGIALYDDKEEIFKKIKEFQVNSEWQCPRSHGIRYNDNAAEYFIFPAPFAHVRVKADYNSVIDPNSYEAFTCLKPQTKYSKETSELNRDANGSLCYNWQKSTDPIGQAQERELIKNGLIKPSEARFQPQSADNNEMPLFGGGSINWNSYRKKWIIIAVESFGKTSRLGEIWYSEANDITGPWKKCWKVVTHNDYSFYNPVHHAFFDQQDGRIIYFEGTYTSSFSGTKQPTPRYEYNQIIYKLDLNCIK